MDVEGVVDSKKSTSAEPVFEVLSNPARVVPAQEKYIKFNENSRYAPLKLKRAPSGFVMLRDLEPSEPVELVSTDSPATAAAGNTLPPNAHASTVVVEDNEPPPPEPFEYMPTE
jgi:26S proteasome regulatory subunit N2